MRPNIMAGVEARELRAKMIMAIVSRPDYAGVVAKLGIDLAVSPREVMAEQILGYLNSGPVVSRTSLADGRIGIYEVEVIEGVPVTEHNLASLQLPPQCLIAAVMRKDHVYVPGAEDRLRAGDTVIALVDDSSVDAMFSMFGASSARTTRFNWRDELSDRCRLLGLNAHARSASRCCSACPGPTRDGAFGRRWTRRSALFSRAMGLWRLGGSILISAAVGLLLRRRARSHRGTCTTKRRWRWWGSLGYSRPYGCLTVLHERNVSRSNHPCGRGGDAHLR